MKARKWMWMGLMSLGAVANSVSAQAPFGVPVAAGLAPPVGAVGPVAVGPAQPATLWSFLGLSKPQLKACREELCAKPCGQLLNKMTQPMAAFSGGILPSFCPPLIPSAAELADEGAVGAAAKIKAEEAQAKARKAAMRYLGTVDCTRFPEAQDALIMGLRGDTNECVRYEAALALGNGCCCTKATMEALTISAACSDRDGKPREYSDRVRGAAAAALEKCVACYVDPNPPKVEKPIEGKPVEGGPPVVKPEEAPPPVPKPNGLSEDAEAKATPKAPRPVGKEYYAKIQEVPRNLIIEEAKKTLEKYHENAMPRRENSVVAMINEAVAESNASSGPVLENGVPTARAEVVSARPQNLWDMVSRNAEPAGMVSYNSKADVVVKSTVEPPSVVVKSVPVPGISRPITLPMPSRMEQSPSLPEPGMVKSEPITIVKPTKPAEVSAYGETKPRPKTTAELAMQPKPQPMATIVQQPKAAAPNPLPSTVTTKDSTKLTERESLKPVDPVKPIDPPSPIVVKPVDPPAPTPTPTALAQRTLTVMTEPTAPAVREQLAASLTKADFESCAEVTPVLVEMARSGEADSTRKAAIQALVRNNINLPAVISTLEKLADDAPPSVRVEAAIGLARLRCGK